MNVYLVTSGSYSDYEVEAAFTTEALAQEYAGRLTHPYSGYRVETFELWDTVPIVEARPDYTDPITSAHIGVQYEKVGGNAVYTCKCGWRDLELNYPGHLAEVRQAAR